MPLRGTAGNGLLAWLCLFAWGLAVLREAFAGQQRHNHGGSINHNHLIFFARIEPVPSVPTPGVEETQVRAL